MLKLYTKQFTNIVLLALALSGCAGLQPNNSTQLPTVPEAIASDYKTGVAAFRKQQYKKALNTFKSILKKHPTSTLAHTNLGLIYLRTNEHALAEKHFMESLKLTPANPIAHNHMGIIYRNSGDFNKALTSYKLAIRYKPGYANAHLNLAILYDIYLHDIASALQHYHHYQALTNNTDKLVAKWIIDNERRLTAMSNEESP